MADQDTNIDPNTDPAPESATAVAEGASEEAKAAVAAFDEADVQVDKAKQTVTVETIGPARKLLTIEIPPERIADMIGDNYDKLQNEATIPGFRRGRAPKRLIEKRFGTSIRDEVQGQLLSEAYTQAIEDEGIDVVGRPDIKDQDNIKLPEEGSLTFQVEVEVVPEFELPSLESIEVTRKALEMNDEQVDVEIARDCERHGSFKEAGEEGAKSGDYLMAEVWVREGENAADDAEEIAHHPQAYVVVPGEATEGKGHITGIIVEKLDAKLAGKKVGDEVVISMTGPSGHEDEKIKGKPITIKARIDRVERLEPLPVEELSERYGMESVEEFRENVKRVVEDRALREQRLDMHEQVTKYLMDKVELELPEEMTNQQVARQLHRHAMDLAYRGSSQEEIEQAIAEMREGTHEDARRNLKQFFILEKAAKQLDIDVTENEINGRIAMIAIQQGRRPEKLRQELFRSGQIEQLYVYLRDQKTLDQIIDNAKVTDAEAAAKKE